VDFVLKSFTGVGGSQKFALKWTMNAIMKVHLHGSTCSSAGFDGALITFGIDAFYLNLSQSLTPIHGKSWGEKLAIDVAKTEQKDLDQSVTISWPVTLSAKDSYRVGFEVSVLAEVGVSNPSSQIPSNCLGYASLYPDTGSTLMTLDDVVVV
jgi:hypothetical protein